MAAINQAINQSPVTSWYTPDVIGADISAYDQITTETTFYASLSGNVMAISMDAFGDTARDPSSSFAAGLWITQDIAGFNADSSPFPGADPDTQFTQLDTTSEISTTLAVAGVGFQISANRMVAWDQDSLWLAEDYTTGAWTETVPIDQNSEAVFYASISGTNVVVARADISQSPPVHYIDLYSDAFAGPDKVVRTFAMPAYTAIRSVSLSGPFLAITTFYSTGQNLADDKSQIWVQDLRTVGDELSLVEVPAPTGTAEWVTTGANTKPMIVSIFYTQMMVTFVDVRDCTSDSPTFSLSCSVAHPIPRPSSSFTRTPAIAVATWLPRATGPASRLPLGRPTPQASSPASSWR